MRAASHVRFALTSELIFDDFDIVLPKSEEVKQGTLYSVCLDHHHNVGTCWESEKEES